jgi:uncharacterized protein (TIGR03083 family)
MPTRSSEREWNLDCVEHAVEAMSVAAQRVAGNTRVPSYPSFTVASLIGHVADVLERVDRGVATGIFDRSTPKPLLDDLSEALRLLSASERTALDALRTATDDMPLAHGFAALPQTVAMYPRYLAIETVIHRWDIETAAGAHTPIDPTLAVVAIDNLFDAWMPLGRADSSAVTGTHRLSVVTDDTNDAWVVTFDHSGVHGRRAHEPHDDHDAEVRGSAEALMLLLWKRLPADEQSISVLGDRSELDGLLDLAYVPDPQRA